MRNLLLVLACFSFVGCMTGPNPIGGIFYTGLQGPNQAVPAKGAGSKRGEACASTILGVVGLGDASIDKAKKAGGITEIAAVDYAFTSIVGAYIKTCTIVTGN